MKFSSWIIILAIGLASCTNPYVEHVEKVAKDEQAKVQQQTAIAQFDPAKLGQFPYEIVVGPDGKIAKRVIATFDRAKRSIDFNMYLLTRTDVVDALIAAKKRGVKVRVILEKTVYQMPKINQKPYDTLAAADIEIVWANEKKFNFNHAKYFIADDAVMIATANMTKSSFEKNREFFVFSEDTGLREKLQQIFNADFEDRELGASFDELYLSPSDSRTKVEQLLKGAVGSIFFYTDSLTDTRILDILAQRKSEWLDVRICTSKQKWKTPDPKLVRRLSDAKIPFTQASGPYVHAKSFLIDRTILAIWSINFTQNSLDNNREVGILLRDSPFLSQYLAIFRKDCVFP